MNYIESDLKVVGSRPIRPDGVDKVIGRAIFAADTRAAGMLWGKIKRSPHAHARILSIDTSAAKALPGVKAVVTAADFPEITSEEAFVGEGPMNFRDLSRNIMARDKALYEGHAVAAVAAMTQEIANQALELIEVKYEVLPFVIDVDEAMAPDAPVLHEDLFTTGIEPKPTAPSNIAKVVTFKKGDIDAGFKEAEVIVEGRYTTQPVHQGYIEPHACLATYLPDGQITIHASSQGHFMIRAYTAKLLGIDTANIRVNPAEIGGGFGGKTLIYLEPVAVMLSKMAGRSVKIQMTREEVFRGSGPTSGASMDVKIGAMRDGTIVAAQQVLKFQAGAFPGSPIGPGCMCGFALYDLPNVSVVGYDVVSNRPKVAAYRAPGAPITSFAVESLIDDLARKLNIDPLTLREKNAAKNGTKTHYGVSHTNIGFEQVLAAVKSHPHWKTPVKEGHGRGMACGFWFNVGGESSANVHVNEDGSVTVATGSPDIGGSRASMGMMVAEVLGIPANRVRATVADTASIGFTHVTGGSRVTFATGMAATQAAEKVVEDLKKRAARIWEIPVDAVEWKDGKAFPAGSNAGAFDPLDLPAIALKAAKTGGPVSAEVSLNAQGAGAGFGIKGQLDNPGFLDYRCPVASDVPMIEAVLVEVPNPRHPFGARGVGEVPIVPPMAAIANAIRSATGLRMPDLPISPPKLRAALDAAG